MIIVSIKEVSFYINKEIKNWKIYNAKKKLANKIVELKDAINTKRVNTVVSLDHNIVITKSWLLGYLEGDGSFFISITDIEPVFTLAASEEQFILLPAALGSA